MLRLNMNLPATGTKYSLLRESLEIASADRLQLSEFCMAQLRIVVAAMKNV